MRVVLLGRDSEEDAAIIRSLNAAGCSAVCVTSSTALYLELLRAPTDSVVLDIEGDPEEARRILSHLRSYESTRDIGIVALGLPRDAMYRVEALSSGADIYLAKPIHLQELTVYLKNIERRRRHVVANPERVCWRLLQSEWRLVAPSGAQITLSHLEHSFIQIVAKNAGKPVKRKDIVTTAFGKDPLSYDNRRLEAVVSRLRRKVHRAYPLSQPIRVVHSIGYVFTEAIICA